MMNRSKHAGRRRQSVSLLASLSEGALLKRACDGDALAFEELVYRTEDRLYDLAMRYVHNESDAKEILQNVYLSAWCGLPSFAQRAQVASWLHRITVNASLMFLRAQRRHREIALGEVASGELDAAMSEAAQRSTLSADESPRPDHAFQAAELRGRLASAVGLLPPALRSAFLLREVGELSTKDAADRLGVSVPATKTRLHRARKVLRQSLVSYVAC
jgi:RNA polymerase sigma-70 factor (ECF subfamily)